MRKEIEECEFKEQCHEDVMSFCTEEYPEDCSYHHFAVLVREKFREGLTEEIKKKSVPRKGQGDILIWRSRVLNLIDTYDNPEAGGNQQ